jgi:hypothetical protein
MGNARRAQARVRAVIRLSQTTRIPAPPEQLWRFFRDMDENYVRWHREHLVWRWTQGEPMTPGAVWFADEWIGWMRVFGRFFVTDVDPPHVFRFRFGLPSSLARAGGSFRFASVGDGSCEMTEEFHFGFSLPVIGRLFDLVLALVLPLGEFRRHIREEGENMAALLGAADR